MTKEQVYKEGLQEALSQVDALIERYADDEVAGYLRMLSAHITGTFMEADGLSAEPRAHRIEREVVCSCGRKWNASSECGFALRELRCTCGRVTAL